MIDRSGLTLYDVPAASTSADTEPMTSLMIDNVYVTLDNDGGAQLTGPIPDGWLIDGSAAGTFSVRMNAAGLSGLAWAMTVGPPLPVILPVNGRFGPRDGGDCGFGTLIATYTPARWHFGADEVEHEDAPDSRTAGQFQDLFAWGPESVAAFMRAASDQIAA